MNDYWNDPPDQDDGIRECPQCKQEVEFSGKFRTAPVYAWEPIYDDDQQYLLLDLIPYHQATDILYLCPSCRYIWIETF
jgi:hypothetical protein